MDPESDHQGLLAGADVVDVSGESVGTLSALVDGSLIIERGWLFPKDYEVPVSAIGHVDRAAGIVFLAVTKARVPRSGCGERFEAGPSADGAERDTG